MVSIRCLVYNHEPYLRQCLDGFIMQKTNFRFEAIVHDDCSTDGSASIIKEYAEKYPDIIKPIYEDENQYSKGFDLAEKKIASAYKGKYIAVCEGDDYWIDPYKLQKQVDFLESHPDYGLVHTKANSYFQSDLTIVEGTCGGVVNSIDDLLYHNRISTLTVCYRREIVRDYNNLFNHISSSWLMGDYPLWLFISANYKVHLIHDITAVYRVLENSASHTSDIQRSINFILSTLDVKYFFIKKLHKESQKKNFFYSDLFELFKLCLAKNDLKQFHSILSKYNVKICGLKFKLLLSLSHIWIFRQLFIRKIHI